MGLFWVAGEVPCMEEPVWASGALFGFGVVACGVVVDDVPEPEPLPEDKTKEKPPEKQ